MAFASPVSPCAPSFEEQAVHQRVACNVRLLRADRLLSLTQAAALAGIHWRHWQKIEGAQVNLTLQTLVRVARAMSVDVAELFGDPLKRLN